MLVQRLWRWTSIKTSLGQCLMLAGRWDQPYPGDGATLAGLGRLYASAGATYTNLFFYFAGLKNIPTSFGQHPTKMSYCSTVVLMPGQRRIQWTSIKTRVVRCLVLAGWHTACEKSAHRKSKTFTQCGFDVGPANIRTILVHRILCLLSGHAALNQHWLNVSCLLGMDLTSTAWTFLFCACDRIIRL